MRINASYILKSPLPDPEIQINAPRIHQIIYSISITFLPEHKDPEKAVSLFHRACDKGSPGACNNAGLTYQNGIKGSTIQKDIYKAIEMFSKSCKLGHPNGCFNLSVIYLTGKDGIPKDLPKAFELSQKSCNMMHPWACANISRMYMPLVMGLRKTHKKQRSTKDLQKNTLDKKSRYEKSN